VIVTSNDNIHEGYEQDGNDLLAVGLFYSYLYLVG